MNKRQHGWTYVGTDVFTNQFYTKVSRSGVLASKSWHLNTSHTH
jgi:hypothetical protein